VLFLISSGKESNQIIKLDPWSVRKNYLPRVNSRFAGTSFRNLGEPTTGVRLASTGVSEETEPIVVETLGLFPYEKN
jgi:hypothetical protein